MPSALSQTNGLRILIVEDMDDDADLMIAALRSAGVLFETMRARSEGEFRALLKESPDVILTDYTLPGFGARRALDIRAELGLDTPCIVVTGSISEEVAVECMKRGAADYLLKDRLARLPSALLQAVNGQAVRQLKLRAERARDAAMKELDHRVRNNLAVVVGLAELTTRGAQSLADFSPIFMGRVRALAVIHDALGEHQWLQVDLRSLVLRLVAPHVAPARGSLDTAGDPISLAARVVQPLGLSLHELAHDALHHGAWRRPHGRVAIAWSVTPGGTLELTWDEHADAPLEPHREPSPSLELVHSLIKHETDGSIVGTSLPDGRRFQIHVPLAGSDNPALQFA